MTHFVLGRRELGKTTLALFLTARAAQRIIIDPRGMIPTSRRFTKVEDVTGAFDLLEDGRVSELVFTADDEPEVLFAAVMIEARALLRAHPTKPIAILVDEVKFCNVKDRAFAWILRSAPRETTQVYITGHRPTDIHPDVRAIADQWLLFRCRHDDDLDVIRKQCDRDVARLVAGLAPFEFVQWDDTTGKMWLFRDRSVWHVPLRAHEDTARVVHPLEELPREHGRVDEDKLF